jgi:hypothetical protein
MQDLKANISTDMIVMLGKSLGVMKVMEEHWMGQSGKRQSSELHSKSRRKDDVHMMARILVNETKACDILNGRRRLGDKKYRSYMHKEKNKTMMKWLHRTCKEVVLI